MPLRVIRSRINPKDVVLAVTSLASVIASVADMASFPPARAAATVILVILQTVQEMESNRDGCYRLARRAAKILLDLKQRMDGRWESAPKALVENILEFEKVLVSIRDFMQELAKVKWMGRLLQKGAIEAALGDYHTMLDEAEQSFQIASLVEIHYTVGILQQRSAGGSTQFVERSETEIKDLPRVEGNPPPYDPSTQGGLAILRIPTPAIQPLDATLEKLDISESSLDVVDTKSGLVAGNAQDEPQVDSTQLMTEELAELDTFGFKRYHQSDIRLRSALKNAGSSRFWEDSSVADVDGRRSIAKRYDSDSENKKDTAIKRWLHDVKMLKNLYHPNLPQLIGFSDERSPTPFILLAQVKLRDPNAYFWSALQNKSIAGCTSVMLKMYRDVSSATLYVQRQLSLNETETQDFVDGASYSLDGDGNVIVGLPAPKDRNTVTFRSYRLTESLVGTALKTLPDVDRLKSLNGTSESSKLIDIENKLVHVKALAGILLPKADQQPELADFLEDLLDDDEDEIPALSRIRELNISAGVHDHAWQEGVHNCKTAFSVGDVGFIKRDRVQMMDKSRFDDFVKLGNVFGIETGPAGKDVEEQTIKLVPHAGDMHFEKQATGQQNQWVGGFVQRQETWPFLLPGDIEGWSLSLPLQAEITLYIRHSEKITSVNEAWRYLMREAGGLAGAANIEPYELILITRSVKAVRYTVKDFSPPPFTPPHVQRHAVPFTNRHPHSHMGGHQFGGPSFGHQPGFNPFGFPVPPPQMLYLFTSSRSDFATFWSDNPSAAAMPPERRRGLPRNIVERVSWPEAYIDYVQLSKEDFESFE